MIGIFRKMIQPIIEAEVAKHSGYSILEMADVSNKEIQKESRGIVYDSSDPRASEEGLPLPHDFDVLYRVYEETSWVRAVVDVITRSMVARGFTFVRVRESASQEELMRLLKFFEAPHPTDTFLELLQDSLRDVLTVGNGYWEKVSDANGQPQQLWSLDCTRMRVKADKKGRVLGYKLKADISDQDVDFEGKDIVHFREPTKGSQAYGQSRLIALTKSITMDQHARSYNNAFFKRGAKVRNIITFKNATQEQIQRNRKYLENIAKKPELSRGDLMFEGEASVQAFGTSPADLEFKELIELVRDEILAVYGVPPSKVSIIETGNIGAGTGESQDRSFQEETIIPLQTRTEYKINQKILKEWFGITDWKFEFNKRIINKKERSQVHRQYLDTGVMTVREVRDELGLPIPDDDDVQFKRLTPSQGLVDSSALVLKLENRFQLSLQRYLSGLKKRLLDRLEKVELKSLTAKLEGQEIERRFVIRDIEIGSLGYCYEQHRFPVITKQLDELEEIVDEIKDEEIEKILNRNLLLIAAAAGALALRRTEKPEAGKYEPSEALTTRVRILSSDLGSFMGKELRDGVKIELLEGIQRGEELPQIAARLDKAMDRPAPIRVKPVVDAEGNVVRVGTTRSLNTKSRSELIARTETNRIANAANIDAYKQSGIIDEVQFIRSGDACPLCVQFEIEHPTAKIDDSGVIDQVPIHHVCRCNWIPIVT